jgi:hypothetical protein
LTTVKNVFSSVYILFLLFAEAVVAVAAEAVAAEAVAAEAAEVVAAVVSRVETRCLYAERCGHIII